MNNILYIFFSIILAVLSDIIVINTINKMENSTEKAYFLVDKYHICSILVFLIFIINYFFYGLSINLFKYNFLSIILIQLTIIDIYTLRLPNKFIIAGVVIALIFAILQVVLTMNLEYLINFLLGFLVGFIPLLLIIIISKGGIGAGDMKLLAMCGCFIGAKNIWFSFMYAVILAGIFATIFLLLKIMNRKSKFAFGPFIALGVFIGMYTNYYILKLFF